MYCTQCGHEPPPDSHFCPACGAPVDGPAKQGETGDVTTVAIDLGVMDDQANLGEVPDLEPGTGMLVVVRGPNAGSRFLLDRDTTTVGRHPDSHVFLDDVTVSRRHTEVERHGEDFAVRDLGSLNGTYVNGDRVEERALASGDELQVGRFKLMFVGTSRTTG
ncbi:MAG TPA: FHA domain-containing protein [Nitriliruptorales bacterium]